MNQNTAGRLCDAQIREWCTSSSIIWVRSSPLAVGLYWKRPCWTLRLKPWPLLLIRSIISGICLWRSVGRFKVFKVRSLSFLLFFLCLSIHLCVSFLFSVQCQSCISVITQYSMWFGPRLSIYWSQHFVWFMTKMQRPLSLPAPLFGLTQHSTTLPDWLHIASNSQSSMNDLNLLSNKCSGVKKLSIYATVSVV